jgi:hypothetical protein
VFPVILRPCAWWGYVGDLQVAPTRDGKIVPVSEWKPPDQGLQEAVRDIRLAISAQAAPSEEFAWPPEPTDLQPNRQAAGVHLSVGAHHLSDEDIDRAVKAALARRAASANS